MIRSRAWIAGPGGACTLAWVPRVDPGASCEVGLLAEGGRARLRRVDPHRAGHRRWVGDASHEALGMRRVGECEHVGPRGDAPRGAAEMDVLGREQADARVVMRGVVPGEE